MDSPIPFQAILFDLDGTLVDSVGDLRAALNQVLADSGRREVSIAQVKRMIGDGAAKLIERGFAATGPVPDAETLTKKLARFLEIYESASTVLTRPFDGVVETLSDLHRIGIRLGICTNKPWAATTRMLHELGLTDYFTAVAGGDTFLTRKPDPRHVLGLLERLGVAPVHAVMVGDNEHDADASRAAGLPVILVSYGYARTPVARIAADAIIDRFVDLPAALRRLRPSATRSARPF